MPQCRPMPTSRGGGMISLSSRLMALFSSTRTCLSTYPCQSPGAPPPAPWTCSCSPYMYKNADLTIPYSRGVCLPSPGRHGRTYAALREKARDGMTCLQGITRHLEGCSVADGGQATSAGSDNNCTSQINLKVSRNETLYRHEDERLCLTSPDRCARGLREPPDRPKQPLARPEFDD